MEHAVFVFHLFHLPQTETGQLLLYSDLKRSLIILTRFGYQSEVQAILRQHESAQYRGNLKPILKSSRMNRVPLEHRGGRTFFKLPNSEISSEDDYFLCLESLKPLLVEKDFEESTPGFYINRIDNTLRLNCFSVDVNRTRNVIQNFAKTNSDKIALIKFEGLDENSPFDLENIPPERKSKILQLRNCWDTSTQIILDLLNKLDVKQAQQLFILYTFQFLPRRITPKIFFEPIFVEYSDFYKRLNTYEANLFWQALLYYQSDNSALGIHVPYNMLRAPEVQYINQYLGIEII